ncbi:GAF domain-containing protein [Gordonia sp. DT101]|uniref:GAF domain-containing protein n=1 Tax=Gordonia sp. DT101 TaxID=3416545 RepID=UPI003CF0938C
MTWYLIECLDVETRSIVFREGEFRDWGSVRALTRSDGIDIAAPISEVIRSRRSLDRVIGGRLGDRRVVLRPVLGYEGEVYGVKTWVDTPSEPVSPERAIASVNWDPQTLIARHTLESYMMSSQSPDGFGDTRDPGQFLRKVVQFDALNELAELCTNNGTRTTFQGPLTVLHDDSHLMTWRGLARSGVGPDADEVRGLFHDVTDTEPIRVDPLTALRLVDLDRDGDVRPAVLVAFRTNPADPEDVVPFLIYWLSARPSYVAESAVDHHPDLPGNLIHPDDCAEFLRAREALQNELDDYEVPTPVRLLAPGGAWAQVRFRLRRYPGAVGNQLLVGRFAPATTD